MFKIQSEHFLTGSELSPTELSDLLSFAAQLKVERQQGQLRTDLKGKTVALLFEKPSLRTHLSFSIAVKELGGDVVESFSANRKKEEPEDVIRVVEGYCHALMLRTHEHSVLERMAAKSRMPIINGLSDTHHPCQILADLLSLKEVFGELKGLKLAYIGDGNNILHSLLLIAPLLGIQLSYACPRGFEPHALILKHARGLAREGGGKIVATSNPTKVVTGANAIYTDVWTSMGFESQAESREEAFADYQVSERLMGLAAPGAIALHCLPMMRGKEITNEVVDGAASAVFRQSANRLHVQKALLLGLMGGK